MMTTMDESLHGFILLLVESLEVGSVIKSKDAFWVSQFCFFSY